MSASTYYCTLLEGNRKFRAVVQVCLPRYRATKNRAEKAQIADYIEAGVHQRGGRFLKHDAAGIYRELNRVGRREKITHALRDAIKKEQDCRNKKENRIHLLHQACQWQSEKDAEEEETEEEEEEEDKTEGRLGFMHHAARMMEAAAVAQQQEEKGRDPDAIMAGEEAEEDEQQDKTNSSVFTNNTQDQEPNAIKEARQMAMQAAAESLAQRSNFAAQKTTQSVAASRNNMNQRPIGPSGMMSDLGRLEPPQPADINITSTEDTGMSKEEKDFLAYKKGFLQERGAAVAAFQAQQQAQQQQHMNNSNNSNPVVVLQEQVRVMTMMMAMREQEIGVLKQALWESASTSTAKDKEIRKLKEELELKTRTLKIHSHQHQNRNPNRQDPPEDPE